MLLIGTMGDREDLGDRIHVYRQLRRRSDIVRTELIPSTVAEGGLSREIFYEMTRTYFEGDVRSGQLVGTFDVMQAEKEVDTDEHYETTIEELSAPPRQRRSIAGFETLHPRYIQGIGNRLFAAIDADRERRRHGVLDLEFLAVVNFCLQLSHLAKDGTGRTGEDLLVLLAAEAGRELTFSPTGYRGALEGPGYPMFYRTAAQKTLFAELAGNFFRYLGLPVPRPLPFLITEIVETLARVGSSDGRNRLTWPSEPGSAIAGICESIAGDPGDDDVLFQPTHPYRFYAEYLASEMVFFTLCLDNPPRYLPAIKERYPISHACCIYSLEAALGQTYQPIADGIGEACDEAVALIEAVKLGRAPRDDKRLEAAVARVEAGDAEIGQMFRDELISFLTEEEKESIRFEIPRNMTGAQLDDQIKAGVSRVRG